MEFTMTACTDAGIWRRNNQDGFCAYKALVENQPVVLAVVCDGLGGLSKGELASASVIRAFSSWFRHSLPEIIQSNTFVEELKLQWSQLICEQNQLLYQYGKQNKIRLGTTVTALLLWREVGYVVHIGDTRIYELSGSLKQMTEDHTLATRELSMGIWDESESEQHRKQNILWQCVGANHEIYPDFSAFPIQSPASYLICSDGFWHKISREEWKDFLPVCQSIEEMERHLCETMDRNKERMERDNMTAVWVQITEGMLSDKKNKGGI